MTDLDTLVKYSHDLQRAIDRALAESHRVMLAVTDERAAVADMASLQDAGVAAADGWLVVAKTDRARVSRAATAGSRRDCQARRSHDRGRPRG